MGVSNKARGRVPPHITKLMAGLVEDASFWGVVARQAADKFMPEHSPESRAVALLLGAAQAANGTVTRESYLELAGYVFDLIKKGG